MEKTFAQSIEMQDRKLHSGSTQVVRFIVTGGTATLLHLSLFWIFKHFMPTVFATTLGFLIAFVYSFTLQRMWTFKSTGHMGKQSVSFLALQMTNLIVNAGLMYVFVTRLGFWDMGMQFLILGTLAVSTFIISKSFIFRGRKQATTA